MRRGLPAAAALTLLACGSGEAPPAPVPPAVAALDRFAFQDATDEAGLDVVNVCGASPLDKGWLTETMGAGAAWLDYDGDGVLDLYVVNGSAYGRAAGEPNRLYRGLGNGRFEERTEEAGVGDRGWGHGVAVGDYDNDGDSDLYVTNLGPNVLYRNEGDGRFRDVTQAAGVGDPAWSASAAWVDLDADGDLDLYVTNYVDFDRATIPRGGTPEAIERGCLLRGIPIPCGPEGLIPAHDSVYRNDGPAGFREASASFGMRLETPRYALGVVSGDLDGDGDTDLYVANDSVRNTLWRNEGGGRFRDAAGATMSAVAGSGRPQAGMGTDAGDVDGDGDFDLVVTNFSHDLNTLYRSEQGRYFNDDSTGAGLAVTNLYLSWGTGLRDFDSDGDLDLFIANGHLYPIVDHYDNGLTYRQTNHLFGNRAGRFVDVSGQAGPGLAVERSFRGAAFADYDDDGDVDVLVTAIDERLLLLRNDGPQGNWLRIHLVGSRVNRDAVGARVEVTAAGATQIRERRGGGSYLSQSEPALHFGLGDRRAAERVVVHWPDGSRSEREAVPAGTRLRIVQPAAGR